MIELLEGVPGSGKSYYAVSERLLSWVRANRKLYLYVEGLFLDRLGAFEGRSVEDLQKQIIVWSTPDEVRAGLLSVENGSAVLIDEAQTIFRSREKVEPELLRMLETHRHKGLDLVMLCQQHGQMTLGVLRLVEVTTKFRRLDRFGLKGRYQAQVRGNPEETEVIRMFTGKYSPKVYAYYSSYASAAIRESAREGSMVKSPTIVLGVVGFLGAVAWFSSGHWLTPSPDVVERQAQQSPVVKGERLPPPPPLPGVSSPPVSVPVVHPVRIQGGVLTEVHGSPQWLYVSESGRILTDEDIAQESGGIVNARMDRGVRILYGSGVIWGGTSSPSGEAVASGGSVLPVPSVATKRTEERAPVEDASPGSSPNGAKDLLASPPGLLATPPDLR